MEPIRSLALEKSFSTGAVLRGLDLAVPQGSIYGLLGRNGCGKTTLLNTLMGLSLPDAGRALVLGQALGRGCPKEKAAVAYVAQGELLPSWAPVRELITLEAELRPSFTADGLHAWLDAENLSPRRRVRDMSAGQRKRLELELALAGQPRVLLMDEPFAALDPVSHADFTEQLLAYAACHQPTILLSSHVLSDLERLCDRIGVLAKGVIAYEASLDDLKERTLLVTARGAVASQAPPAEGQIASYSAAGSTTWIIEGLQSVDVKRLEREGFRVSHANLEGLGVELIRSLDPRVC